MPKLIVEACCGSADDVIEAQKAGAHRVELNSNLSLGGLTPSLGTLKAAKAETGLPIMAMVRPRESGFLYTAAEFRTALLDAEALLENGADGIVFGFLNSDGTVDAGRCREMLRLAGKRQTVASVCSGWVCPPNNHSANAPAFASCSIKTGLLNSSLNSSIKLMVCQADIWVTTAIRPSSLK